MKNNIVTLTKIIDRYDDRKFYYTVDNKAFKWFFYDLVKAENFIKSMVQDMITKKLLTI